MSLALFLSFIALDPKPLTLSSTYFLCPKHNMRDISVVYDDLLRYRSSTAHPRACPKAKAMDQRLFHWQHPRNNKRNIKVAAGSLNRTKIGLLTFVCQDVVMRIIMVHISVYCSFLLDITSCLWITVSRRTWMTYMFAQQRMHSSTNGGHWLISRFHSVYTHIIRVILLLNKRQLWESKYRYQRNRDT